MRSALTTFRKWMPGMLLCLALAGCAQPQAAKPKSFVFWPPAPDSPRIQFLTAFQSSADVEPPKSALDNLIWGKEAVPVLPISKPYGAKFWDNKVYVCDIGNHCIAVLDLKQNLTRVMGVGAVDRLQIPADIAIAPDGIKYVADRGRGDIVVFDAQDRYVTALARSDWKPVAIALRGDELAVADMQGQRIVILDRRDGRVVRAIGGPGTKDGQFAVPIGVAFDPQGNIWTIDMMRCRAQKFSPDGKVLTAFGAISDSVGNFARPKQVSIDREGLLYVVDSAFQNVQVFDEKGQCLTFFGAAGTHGGAMFLPVGVGVHDVEPGVLAPYVHPAFQAQKIVVVTNQMGVNKVALYAVGRLREGRTVADVLDGRVNVIAGIVAGAGSTSRPAKLNPVPSSGGGRPGN